MLFAVSNIVEAITGLLPFGVLLLFAEHLAPLDFLALLRAVPRLSHLLTVLHVSNTDAGGKSILHLLVEEREEELMKLVLTSKNIALNSKDHEEWTPLSIVTVCRSETTVKLLRDIPEVKVELADTYGQTPLRYAADDGHDSVVKDLLAQPEVKVDSKTKRGYTPLFLTA